MAAPGFPSELALTEYKDPTFQEKFVFALIEGLRELNLAVQNGNILAFQDFVGANKVREVLKLDREWKILLSY